MSMPQRRIRSISPPPGKAGVSGGIGPQAPKPILHSKNVDGCEAAAPTSSQTPVPKTNNNNNNNNNNNANNNKVDLVPSILVTHEAAHLIVKMAQSTDVYRSIFSQVESAVVQGVMKGIDEKSIVAECKRIIDANPIVEMSELKL